MILDQEPKKSGWRWWIEMLLRAAQIAAIIYAVSKGEQVVIKLSQSYGPATSRLASPAALPSGKSGK